MYGGLFGDLPEARKSSQNNNSYEGAEGAGAALAGSSAAPVDQDQQKSAASTAPSASAKSMVQPSIARCAESSGTAVAFVPTAALKPRPRRPAAPAAGVPRRAAPPASAPAAAPVAEAPTTDVKQKEMVVTEDKIADVDHPASAAPCDSGIGPDATDQGSRLQVDAAAAPRSSLSSTLSEERRQQLRQQALDDPYDPLVPNDVLQYWERRALAAEREALERQRQEELRQQEDLRRRLEEERRALEQRGDVVGLVQQDAQRQRGRGRGVSNLPAWLLAKQKQNSQS